MSHLRDFLKNALLIPEDEIDNLGIEAAERTRTRSLINSDIHMEVRVTMADPDSRDYVASKGRLLATYVNSEGRPTAGIRMEVPEFLASDFKTLEQYGRRMRRMHGTATRKYIKYDDGNWGLIMELKLPESENWLNITPTAARSFLQNQDRQEIEQANIAPRQSWGGRVASGSANFEPIGRPRTTSDGPQQQPQDNVPSPRPEQPAPNRQSWNPPKRQ